MELKRNLLSVALASALFAWAGHAHAQADTPTVDQDQGDEADQAKSKKEKEKAKAKELGTIQVSGIRYGIESAIDVKQSSTSIVEAVSAEDIGKLPDVSIADSIARLPGITAQRDRGRARDIHIRGLSGDFATTTLNGREQVSMSNSRGVEFDQYPSELLSQVLVYKTPDAALVGQGLSGTVDMRSIRPLDYGKQAVAFNLRGDMNRLDGDKKTGFRGSLAYIDQFADDTIGLALGYARLNNPGQGNKFESWGYDNGAIGGGQLYDYENDNTRDGLMATLQYQPNDEYEMVLDVYYSRFDREENERGLEFG
ncbi:MAG: TonB-dependent receptor plug domain-containing protein, partial [Lysobacteraceae bacterium]